VLLTNGLELLLRRQRRTRLGRCDAEVGQLVRGLAVRAEELQAEALEDGIRLRELFPQRPKEVALSGRFFVTA
jgi:hypothetical protein